jgi:hypothetical protein
MYNLSALQNSTTIVGIVQYANDVTGQLLAILFVLAVFFISLMQLKRYEFSDTLLTSSFMCFILSALLVYAKMLALVWPLLYLIIAAMTFFYKVTAE